MRFEPDDAQAPVLEHDRGNLLVTGPPGSGKTALLRERHARLVEAGADPSKVVLFTLNRRAAREARDHLVRRLRRSLPQLPVFTAHGFAFDLLSRRFGDLGYAEPPQVLSAPEQYAAVAEMLAGEEPGEWPTLGHLLGNAAFARQVADFCLRAQERLLDPDGLEALAEASPRPRDLEVARFYRRYLDALAADPARVDFAGLLYQAVTLLDRGLPAEETFQHVLVDDYQDATIASEGILAAVARSATSTVVAADPDGHVFSYRGGTLEPLHRVREALGGVAEVALPGSHRLGTGVAALTGLDGDGAPAASVTVEAREFAHPGEEAEAVAVEILRWRVEEDVPWERIAVIVRRYGPYLTALRHALQRHDVPFVVVAEAAEVAAEPANRPVIDLLRYVFRPASRDDLLEPLLVSRLGGLHPHAIRRLRRHARLAGRSLREMVETAPLDDIPEDLRAAIAAFRTLIEGLPAEAERGGPARAFFWIWTTAPAFAEMVADEERHRDLDAMSALGEVLSRFTERRPGAGVEDYLETLEAAAFGPDPWVLPEERHPHAVRVVSAHRAHGIEVDVALVVGCIEGEFPSGGRLEPMLDLRALAAPRPPAQRRAERLAEERALFRLAVSRASRRTILFASRSTGARNPRTPSRFAERLGAPWKPADDGTPPATSLRSMEASLRRRLGDTAATSGERLAALAVLPRVGAEPGGWWWGRGWTESPNPLHGEEEMLTSYSRLSTLENCALQYLYQTEMGLDQDETYQMWLGSAVHGIIDRVQQGELARDEEAVLAAFDEIWDPTRFPNRAIEHRRYLDGRDMLRRWLHNESPDVVASEQQFAFPIDGALLRGRIDAIFAMQNGHTRVVDYKTSRYPPTREEVKTDLQLAAYFLAMRRDPKLAALGDPGLLELHYLGKARQQGGYARLDFSPRTVEGYEAWAEGRLHELLAQVRSEEFAPNPEAECRFCSFKTLCPVWQQGGEVPA